MEALPLADDKWPDDRVRHQIMMFSNQTRLQAIDSVQRLTAVSQIMIKQIEILIFLAFSKILLQEYVHRVQLQTSIVFWMSVSITNNWIVLIPSILVTALYLQVNVFKDDVKFQYLSYFQNILRGKDRVCTGVLFPLDVRVFVFYLEVILLIESAYDLILKIHEFGHNLLCLSSVECRPRKLSITCFADLESRPIYINVN
jgi:hypothetical protein